MLSPAIMVKLEKITSHQGAVPPASSTRFKTYPYEPIACPVLTASWYAAIDSRGLSIASCVGLALNWSVVALRRHP